MIRTVVTQAAATHGIRPWTLSFMAATQTLTACPPRFALGASGGDRRRVDCDLLGAIAAHRFGNRTARDAMKGHATEFAREHYVEEVWRVVDPIPGVATPLAEYERHTWCPLAAARLIAGAGFGATW